jgi:hypothetical protein
VDLQGDYAWDETTQNLARRPSYRTQPKDKFRVPKALIEYLCTGQKPKLEGHKGWEKEEGRKMPKLRKLPKKKSLPTWSKRKKIGCKKLPQARQE